MDLNTDILTTKLNATDLDQMSQLAKLTKPRIRKLRKNPELTTLRELHQLDRAGYIQLSIR